jgi:hypothetical protein
MTIKKKKIEVVTITGNVQETPKAYAYINKRGFVLITMGHIVMKGGIDITRFRLVARKQMRREPLKGGE